METKPVTLLITCAKYKHLIPECLSRIQTYAPFLKPLQMLVTHDDVSRWTDSVADEVRRIESELITVLLEDYYLNEPAFIQKYHLAINCMVAVEVKKFDLSRDRTQFPHVDFTEEIIVSTQTARYRSSLQAAIWKKDYLLKMLKPGRTPWEFELLGEKEAMNDGAVILGTRTGVLSYDNIMLKGQRK